VGVQETSDENIFTVFPNPSSGFFTINSDKKISSIEIINILGEKIYSVNTPHLTSYKIDLGNQPGGIYFYKVLLEEGKTSSGKILIE
jgi:hypothetical protein